MLALAAALAPGISSPARGATITWTGLGATTNWNLAANWSSLIVPGAGDIAVFDGTSAKPALMNVNVNVGGVDVTAGYAGTITQGAGRSVTIGATGWSQAGGGFIGSAAAVTISGPWIQSGGAYTSTSGTLSVSGSLTQSGGTFSPNGGTLRLTGAAAGIDVPGSLAVWNLTLAQGNAVAKTLALGDVLVVDGLLTLTNGTWNGGELRARGGITQAAGFDGGTGPLRIDGGGDQVFTGSASAGSGALPHVMIDKVSGTLTLAGVIRTSLDWTYIGGTLDAGTSIIVFAGAQTINGGHVLANVEFRGASVKTLAPGTSLLVTGLLRLTDGTIGGDTILARGPIIQAAGFDGGSATLRIDGSADQTFTGSATAGAGALPNVIIDKPSGTLALAGTIRVFNGGWSYVAGMLDPGASLLVFDSGSVINGDQALGAVTLRGGGAKAIGIGQTLTVNGTLTLTDGTWDGGELHAHAGIAQAAGFDGGSGVLRVHGAGDQAFTGSATNNAGLLPTVVIEKPTGTLTLGGTIRTARDWTHVAGPLDAGASTLIIRGPATLTVPGVALHRLDVRGGTASLGGALALTGDLRIVSGQLDSGANAIDVAGSLIVSGILNAPGSDLRVVGNVTVTGSLLGEPGLLLAGTAPQVVDLDGFAVTDLRLDNAAGAMLDGDVGVSGTLALATGTLAIGPHRLTIAEPIAGIAANLLGGATSSITVGGVSQGISLPGSVADLAELEIANPAGVALAGALAIHGTLVLDGGTLLADPFAVTIVAGGAVSRTSGHVIGVLQKPIPAGGALSVTFEVGDALGYAPVLVDWLGVGTSGNLAASTVAGDHPELAATGLAPGASANRTWILSSTGLGAEPSLVTLTYLLADLDPAADPQAMIGLVSSGGMATLPPVTARSATSASLSLSGAPIGTFALANRTASVAPLPTPGPSLPSQSATPAPTPATTPAPTPAPAAELPDTADGDRVAHESVAMLAWLALSAITLLGTLAMHQRRNR